MKVPLETPKRLKQLWPLASVYKTMMNACLCVCVHVYTYVCVHECKYVQYVCVWMCACVHECKYVQYVCVCGCVHVYMYVCMQVTLCVAGLHLLLPPIQCMQMGNLTVASQWWRTQPMLRRWMASNWWRTQPSMLCRWMALKVMENPAYVSHVYIQIYPTLPTRPRPITPGHPSTHNTLQGTRYILLCGSEPFISFSHITVVGHNGMLSWSLCTTNIDESL